MPGVGPGYWDPAGRSSHASAQRPRLLWKPVLQRSADWGVVAPTGATLQRTPVVWVRAAQEPKVVVWVRAARQPKVVAWVRAAQQWTAAARAPRVMAPASRAAAERARGALAERPGWERSSG